jgi:hypothetical protein
VHRKWGVGDTKHAFDAANLFALWSWAMTCYPSSSMTAFFFRRKFAFRVSNANQSDFAALARRRFL